MAAGKVITGYSRPYVALYKNTEGTVSYSDCQRLARGVNVTVTPNNSDATVWYADNVLSESGAMIFTGGSVALECDHPKTAAAKMIEGTPETSSINVDSKSVPVVDYDDRQTKNYVGIGFVVRFQEDGVASYAAVVLTKAMFSDTELSAATQSEGIEFQDTTLNATLFKDDSTYHKWKRVANDLTSEDEAESVVKAMLGANA